MEQLLSKIESLLFVSSKPLHIKQLSKFLQSPDDEVRSALLELQKTRKHAGVILLEANGYWQMATHGENVDVVKNFLNSDLREKLTDATVEVLSIIAYRQPISKAETEAIRGVNSQYSIRHLLMRGLIEKIPNPNDARGSLYQVTTEFLQHLGIQSIADLPAFENLVAHIKLPEALQVSREPVASDIGEGKNKNDDGNEGMDEGKFEDENEDEDDE